MDTIEQSARQELGGPVRIVSGPAAPAGALALQLAEQPLVLIDGRLDRSPWLSADLVARCGVLQLGTARALPAGHMLGTAFPGLAWRVLQRDPFALACPP